MRCGVNYLVIMKQENLFKTLYWTKLFPLYYKLEISEEFLRCADKQLSFAFEKDCGIELPVTGITIYPLTDVDEFNYVAGNTSSFSATLMLVNGILPITICWKSKTGKVYYFSDDPINGEDIEFWFEGLDAKKVMGIYKPSYSLFTYPFEIFIDYCKKTWDITISPKFLSCADTSLSPVFENKTGLKFCKKLVGGWVSSEYEKIYAKGETSYLLINICISHYSTNTVKICWRSKSGRIYDIGDVDIDCNDLEFWFEGLDPVAYHKQLYPKVDIPFKLKNLTYELEIQRLDIYLDMEMFLKPMFDSSETKKLTDQIDDWLNKYNEKNMADEKREIKYGSVDNFRHTVENNKLVYHFSWSTAGFEYMKAFLKYLSTLNAFQKIIVG